MSTPVLYHEPAHQAPAPARGSRVNPYPAGFARSAAPDEPQPARPGQLAEARAAALFASDLSAHREHTENEVAAAIRRAIDTHNGLRGCAGEVAAAYGEYPETAAGRMRWARAVVEDMYGSPPVPARRAGRRPSLAEQGYVHGSFGGVPILVGPELAAQIKATRGKQS